MFFLQLSVHKNYHSAGCGSSVPFLFQKIGLIKILMNALTILPAHSFYIHTIINKNNKVLCRRLLKKYWY